MRLARLVALSFGLSWLLGSPPAQASDAPVRVAFFGSSTSVGVGASRTERRWSSLLCGILGWEEHNLGLSGSALLAVPGILRPPTAPERLHLLPAGAFERVLVMYGANDAVQKSPLPAYHDALESLLATLEGRFAGNVVFISPQPNPLTDARRAPYDQTARAAAAAAKVPYIAANEAYPAAFLQTFTADGLHMNDWGHAAVASYVAGQLRQLKLAPAATPAMAGVPYHEPLVPLAGNALRVAAAALTTGTLAAVDVGLSQAGALVVAVERPDGHGGYEGVYRTPPIQAPKGLVHVKLPAWCVQAGDHLAAWGGSRVLGGYGGEGGHWAARLDQPEWKACDKQDWHHETLTLAISAAGPTP